MRTIQDTDGHYCHTGNSNTTTVPYPTNDLCDCDMRCSKCGKLKQNIYGGVPGIWAHTR